MADRKFKMAKIDEEFDRRIKEVALARLNNKLDKKMCKEQSGVRRFTKAMTRYEPLWEILKNAQFREDMI